MLENFHKGVFLKMYSPSTVLALPVLAQSGNKANNTEFGEIAS